MSNDSTAVDFGINLLEEEIDDVIFRTNEFLTDATFTGGQGPFWWLSLLEVLVTTKTAVFQLLANLLRETRFPDGTKLGQNLQENHSSLFPVSSNISNTAVCSCKGTHLSRYKRMICRKSLIGNSFLTLIMQTKGISETPTSFLILNTWLNAHLLPEKSYSNEVSKLNVHKSHSAHSKGVSGNSATVIEPTVDQMLEPTSATWFYTSLYTSSATSDEFLADENQRIRSVIFFGTVHIFCHPIDTIGVQSDSTKRATFLRSFLEPKSLKHNCLQNLKRFCQPNIII